MRGIGLGNKAAPAPNQAFKESERWFYVGGARPAPVITAEGYGISLLVATSGTGSQGPCTCQKSFREFDEFYLTVKHLEYDVSKRPIGIVNMRDEKSGQITIQPRTGMRIEIRRAGEGREIWVDGKIHDQQF